MWMEWPFPCDPSPGGSPDPSVPWPSEAPAITGAGRPSGVSAYLRCHSSSTLCTTGMSSKLWAGGGEEVAHSSVRASHGSSPAAWADDRDVRTTFRMKITIEAAIMKAPMVETMFQKFHPANGEYR